MLAALVFLASSGGAVAETCAYAGGWALRVSSSACPASVPHPCGTGILQARCCPSGLVCSGEGNSQGNYCCLAGPPVSPLGRRHASAGP